MEALAVIISRLASNALDLLFPLECLGCGRGGRLLCAECVAAIPRLALPLCARCAQPSPLSPCRRCLDSPLALDGLRAPFRYDGDDNPLRDAIHAFKYRNMRALAPELAQLLASFLAQRPAPAPLDALVAVPMHPKRLRQRGYNQAALLANELAKLIGVPAAPRLLRRASYARPQVKARSYQERRENVAGRFAAAPQAAGQKLLLLDDVTTTGSTLSACAAALKAAGAAQVWGLALAKEP